MALLAMSSSRYTFQARMSPCILARFANGLQ